MYPVGAQLTAREKTVQEVQDIGLTGSVGLDNMAWHVVGLVEYVAPVLAD